MSVMGQQRGSAHYRPSGKRLALQPPSGMFLVSCQREKDALEGLANAVKCSAWKWDLLLLLVTHWIELIPCLHPITQGPRRIILQCASKGENWRHLIMSINHIVCVPLVSLVTVLVTGRNWNFLQGRGRFKKWNWLSRHIPRGTWDQEEQKFQESKHFPPFVQIFQPQKQLWKPGHLPQVP